MTKGKKRRHKRFTPLSKHIKKRKKLLHPLNHIPIEHINWERDFLPEFLWIDALAEYYKVDPNWYDFFDEFIDLIEEYLDDENILIGTISDFGKVPEDIRPLILKENKEYIHKAFIKPIGKSLSLYSNCPAQWLIPSELLKELKKDEEINKLKNAVIRLLRGKDDYCRLIRYMPFRRICKHGKVLFPPDTDKNKLFIDLNQYPEKCEIKDKVKLGALIHSVVNINIQNNDPDFNWSKIFWKTNYDLSKCVFRHFRLVKSKEVKEDFMKKLKMDIDYNIRSLKKYLDSLIDKIKINLYDPSKDEIILGLFARIIRLYSVSLQDPNLWSQDLSRILLRCLLDSAITLCYLVKENREELYKDFINYGRGQEKLLMLNLQDNYPDEKGASGETFEFVLKNLGLEFFPEFINIDLSRWTKDTIRKMAKKSGFEKEYSIIYSPTSSDIHGSWVSIKNINLRRCMNPLHRFHFMPQVSDPPLFLNPIMLSTEIIGKTIEICIIKQDFPTLDFKLKSFRDFYHLIKVRDNS